MKNLAGPFLGLHFMRHNSVVIDTTHDPILFHNLTMQVKRTASEITAETQSVHTSINLTKPLVTTETLRAIVGHSSERNTTGTVTYWGNL